MNKLTKTFFITTALLATAGTAVAVASSGHENHDHSIGMSHSAGTEKHMKGQHQHEKADQHKKMQQHKQEHHAMSKELKDK